MTKGIELLGMDANTAMPISLSSNETILALMGTIPAVATFMVIVAFGWQNAVVRLEWAIPVLGTVSALLGLAQILVIESNNLYFYQVTNSGFPVGFFANVNHQACFLLMCLPFVASLAGKLRKNWNSGDEDYAKFFIVISMACLILIGVLASGSVAGYALLLPVLVISIALANMPKVSAPASVASPAIVIMSSIAGIFLVLFSPVLDGLGETSFEHSETSRLGLWETSLEAAGEHWLAGTGPGTFASVYQLYENADTVTTKFANHAHNDYLEAIIEFGLPGAVLLFAGVALVLILFVRVWTERRLNDKRLKKAAATALLVVLLHSFVDYPVRTPAIACLFATCFAIVSVGGRTHIYRPAIRKRAPVYSSGENESRLVI